MEERNLSIQVEGDEGQVIPFTQIANDYITSILTPQQKTLLFILIYHARAGRSHAYPSYQLLAREVGMSISSVRRTIRELEGLGVVIRVEQYQTTTTGKRMQVANNYEISEPCPVTLRLPNPASTEIIQVSIKEAAVGNQHWRTLSSKVGERLRKEYGARCLCCGGREEEGAVLTVDHVQPRSKGGSNSFANLQLLCATCNFTKGSQHLDFRNPDLQEGRRNWSEAERVVREYLTSHGRAVAYHPDYRLPKLVVSFVREWQSSEYQVEEIVAALQQAAEANHPYRYSLVAADAYLKAATVASTS